MNLHQQVREYVRRTASISPLAPRLRKIKGSDSVADIIDRATLRVCGESLPPMLRNVPQLWPFFDNSPRDVKTLLLVHRALDASRKQFIKETSVSGGAPLEPKTLQFDIEAEQNLARFTESGQAFATEPAREIEQRAQLETQAAALEARKQLATEEFTILRQNLATYGQTLPRKWRTALHMVCNEPRSKLPNKVVATRCGIAPATVKRIREHFDSLSARFFSLMEPPEERASLAAPESVPTIADSELISEIADAPDPLIFAEALHAPEIEIGEVSESILQGYARRDSSALHGDRWGKGRRMYSDVELVTGPRYGGRFDDPARIAERDQYANKKFSARDMRALEKKSAEVGFDLNGWLRAIESFLMKRDSVDRMLASTLFKPKPST